MGELKTAAQTLIAQRTRLPAARRFDRNCVLAATAGQIIAATELDMEIAEIIVGDTQFDVGIVAHNIILAPQYVDATTATVAAAGMVGMWLASGLPFEELRSHCLDKEFVVMERAAALLQPWIDDGRYASLVRALDTYRFAGSRRLQ